MTDRMTLGTSWDLLQEEKKGKEKVGQLTTQIFSLYKGASCKAQECSGAIPGGDAETCSVG